MENRHGALSRTNLKAWLNQEVRENCNPATKHEADLNRDHMRFRNFVKHQLTPSLSGYCRGFLRRVTLVLTVDRYVPFKEKKLRVHRIGMSLAEWDLAS